MRARADVFREWFAIDATAARVIDVLYAASGRIVTHDTLRAVAEVGPKGVTDLIRALAEVMEGGAFTHHPCKGVRLTPAGLKDCDRALLDAVRRTAAAA